MLHAVIMAGGSGTRFWPESRGARPKQLLRLVGERSMIQSTVDRLGSLVPSERTLVVTNRQLIAEIRAQLPQLPVAALVGEPCRRDTAPCIGLAALLILRDDPQGVMAVMPSDHVIAPDAAFQHAIRLAAHLVEQSPERLITFGIRPTYPAESFGYIERGAERAADARPAALGAAAVYQVQRFREKPKAEVAREYLAAGTFYWNSGIFVWKAATIVAELEARQGEMMAHLRKIADAWTNKNCEQVFVREFEAVRGISIDYAVMEHSRNVLVVEAPFAWDDVGSWQAIARLQGADADGNTLAGRHLGLHTTGTIVRTPDDHLVVTLGVSDLIVVHTPDATLVANKHDEESIRQLVTLLEERGWREYL
ncbi:MAG: mannose-1-phosphate guanylyltransferase [Pirellulales bacterium]